jgi:wobble nucleotide-excising tRNase
VRQGLSRFSETEGKCPYCQQTLPDDFEDEIAAIFDEQYQKSIDELNSLLSAYESDMRGFVGALKANKEDVFPKLDLTEYDDKLTIFEKTVESNIQLIIGKTKEPSLKVELENIKPIHVEINAIITELNKQIKEHNDVVNARNKNKNECKTKVWELIAFIVKPDIASYNTSYAELVKEITALKKKITDDRTSLKTIENEIADKSKSVRSTKPTIDSINNLLRDSGFQGFSLREKQGHKNVYEVVREDNRPVERLSDGEKNFIAFLYFYQLVKGSHDESDTVKDKIVVIDDPVSSLDSSVLFIVSTLVREMIEVCLNNIDYLGKRALGDYIKQFFVMTHNVYFHREISYNQAEHFQPVSFYVVNKANNVSSVRLCVRPSISAPTEQENYNPIKNSYAVMWSELNELETPLTILNVIRRIMEYYFMQLCGYDGNDVRKTVLENNKDDFIGENDDGSPDYTKYHLASAMLSYISHTTTGITDGLNYVDDYSDATLCKDVFEMIFKTLGQEQHYKMMMGLS